VDNKALPLTTNERLGLGHATHDAFEFALVHFRLFISPLAAFLMPFLPAAEKSLRRPVSYIGPFLRGADHLTQARQLEIDAADIKPGFTVEA
jgi:hypothetical protein